MSIRPIGDPACGAVGNCVSVAITPHPTAATCTLSNGSVSFSIDPITPAINTEGIIISIDGISTTNQSVARTQYNDTTFLTLPIGVYTYSIVYGDSACIKTGQVTIDQSGTVGTPIVSNVVGPVCFGSSTGAVTLNVPGETGNVLQWSLDGGINDPFKLFTAGSQITGIPAGPAPSFERVISVRRDVSDPCDASVVFSIQNANPDITADFDITPATCSGADGAITNIVPGGGSGNNYQYSIDNGLTYKASGNFSALAGGIYTLRVKDGNGCEKDFTANVTFPDFIDFVVEQTNADCTNNGNSGVIKVTINAPGQYQVALSTDRIQRAGAEPVYRLQQSLYQI